MMNTDLELLQPYPFEKLATLKSGIVPPEKLPHISLSIGEPKHTAPAFVITCFQNALQGVSLYPTTKGLPELREAISIWAQTRFKLSTLCPEKNILPVNGTREALFSFTQAVINRNNSPKVLMPNPFYQIYEGASLLAGAEPVFLNCTEENQFTPNFDQVCEQTWRECQLLFLCSPGNPTGAVIPSATLEKLITLSDKYNFVIAADECYSELYFDETIPPNGLLEVCAKMGRDDYKNCVVFHSLSKRSNLPGLRSGFVAGDSDILKKFLLYRTYHGCAMPIHTQLASISAWQDEKHVIENRAIYRKKFDQVLSILEKALPVQKPDAGFYLWAKTPIEDTEFARKLFSEKNITVLPGTYLARESKKVNPGRHRVRMAMVAPIEECIEAAKRIQDFCNNLSR